MTASASRSLSQKRGRFSGGQRFCDGTNSRHRRNGDRPDRNPGTTPTLHPVTSAVDELKGQMNWRQGRLNRPWKARRPTQRVQVGLANLWQTAVGGSRSRDRPGARPGLACWFVVEPPAGIEPATPSLPWNHREPLCGPPFSQVAPDRQGKSYRFSFRSVMRSLSTPTGVRYLAGQGRAGERSRAATVDDPVLCTQPKIGRWPLATA
jgi:hypothetical protein